MPETICPRSGVHPFRVEVRPVEVTEVVNAKMRQTEPCEPGQMIASIEIADMNRRSARPAEYQSAVPESWSEFQALFPFSSPSSP